MRLLNTGILMGCLSSVLAVNAVLAADTASPHLGRHATKPTDLGANSFGTNVMTVGTGDDSGGGSGPDLANTAADSGHVKGKLDHSAMITAGGADNLGASAAGHVAPS